MIKIHLLELVQYCQHQHGQILSSNLPETNMILKWLLRLNEIVCNHQMFALYQATLHWIMEHYIMFRSRVGI